MVMKKLKVGIIGLGVGEKHIEGYEKHIECEVVSLCDFNDEKYNYARLKYPDKKIVKNSDEILEDKEINVVSIASYDNYHYKQMVKAIKNDKHIFIEKPLCLYKEEAEHIKILLKEKQHLHLSSNLILRMCPRFKLLKKMILDGQLGQIYYVEGDYNYGRLHKITDGWRGKIDFYSGVYGGGIHIVDLILWLTGDTVVEVAAYGNNISSKNSDFRFNDMVVSILKFESGLVAKISVNLGCIFPHFHKLDIYGTKSTFINGMKEGYLYKSCSPDNKVENITEAYPGIHKGDLLYNFIDSILYNTKQIVTEEDIFRSMSVCFAIEKASVQSGNINVTYI
jgi:predicted dehydrogenase